MKTFYEMMMLLEDEQGLGDQVPQDQTNQSQVAPQEQPQEPQGPQDQNPSGGNGEQKHYMFFSNLKVIKGMVEKMLSMDPSQVDALLDDGHDWASDHISTSKDDVEEVHNWLISSMDDSGVAP